MKFTDHNSPEKSIIDNNFKSIPYMDMWISSIIEGYIYEVEEFEYLENEDEDEEGKDIKHFCLTRYGVYT